MKKNQSKNFNISPVFLFLMGRLVVIPVLITLPIGSLKFTSAVASTLNSENTRKSEDSQIVQAAKIVNCEVTNIQTGQLALRFSPNGRSRAGLNNGNLVRFISSQGIWYYVRVLTGPNSRVNGLEGWVNSNYLECYWD
ncbi:MAG: SH3 domain-containing protein [Phormidium sp.]